MDINKTLAGELGIKESQVEATVKLIDEGNTIPFIARYRKEVTGALNDEILRNLHERLLYLRGLEERKAQVIASIEEQGKLDGELKAKIEAAATMVAVEDLYRPYKPKRKTRASVAKEKGLMPLAEAIMAQNLTRTVEEEAADYISDENDVKDAKSALAGAMDIIAEIIADEADFRTDIRKLTFDKGTIITKSKNAEEQSVYEMYYDFSEAVNKIASHRVLAINRGEAEKILTVKLEAPVAEIETYLMKKLIKSPDNLAKECMCEVIKDSYARLIAPAIEREIRNELTEKAEDGAITVFGKNLEQLLMQQPIAGKVVLGWDPAFRTGCKLALVDSTGKVLATTVIYPTAPQFKVAEAKATLKKLYEKYKFDLISLGNGTASRESEQIIVEFIKETAYPIQYVIVSEAGASVYSASKLATEEFPKFDVGQRSAASIARRLQDPLAELVKIDPKSIGVGQYQHDMNQKKLENALGGVVEDSVNKVGVDLNTASASLLSYISGISKVIANNIVEYRESNGKFKNRKELLKVPKLGPKAFEQCAGFMRINDGDNPLDATSVHPESYDAANKLMEELGVTMDDIKASQKQTAAAVKVQDKAKDAPRKKQGLVVKNKDSVFGAALMAALKDSGDIILDNEDKVSKKPHVSSLEAKIKDKKKMAQILGIGELTLMDIIKELEKPARDPREDMPSPILKSDILELKDLKKGMELKGTVRNVIDFGAFVDIGVHEDGLVHISQMTDKYIKHPLEVVSVGDVVDVTVLDVDMAKKRISLTMKKDKKK